MTPVATGGATGVSSLASWGAGAVSAAAVGGVPARPPRRSGLPGGDTGAGGAAGFEPGDLLLRQRPAEVRHRPAGGEQARGGRLRGDERN